MQACLEKLCRMISGNVSDLAQLVRGWDVFDPNSSIEVNLMTWVDTMVIGLQELAQHTKEMTNNSSDETYASLISIQQTRSLATLLEIVCTIRMDKFVVSRTHAIAVSESAKATLLVNKRVMRELQSYAVENDRISILNVAEAVDIIIFHPSFSSLLFNRFHGRIILTYLAVEYDAGSQNAQILGLDRKLHRVIFSNSTIKALAVTQLSRMMKGMEWLKNRSAQLLSEVLLSENGLQAVLQGYLEGNLTFSPFLNLICVTLMLGFTAPSQHQADLSLDSSPRPPLPSSSLPSTVPHNNYSVRYSINGAKSGCRRDELHSFFLDNSA